MTEIVIKRGSSLLLTFTFEGEDGTPRDLTTSVVSSQIRDVRDELVIALPVLVPLPTTGVASVSVADTDTWPIGTLRCDVRLVEAGLTALSETFAIRIERAVTR